jgi:hypothetical protein
MSLTPQKTFAIIGQLRYSLAKVADIRRGFYCTICDARVQTHFKDFFAATNLKTFTTLYFSEEFCWSIVEKTIKASYELVTNVYRYLNAIVTLMNCQTGVRESPQLDLNDAVSKDVKNCFVFQNIYFFYFCQNYCSQFNLVRVSPIIDGDLLQLKQFVDFFVKYRQEAFAYSKNNILADGVSYEENFLVDMYPEVLRDLVFFRAVSGQSVLLDQYNTEITMYGGINILPSILNSKYELLILGSAVIAKVIVLLSWWIAVTTD